MALPEPAAEVVARIQSLAAASQRPTLTAEEVTSAIKAHPMVDRDGIAADDAAWVPTWDLNAILAELWGVKAGKVAGDFNFSADDARYDKGEVLKNCLEMESLYASRRIGAASTLRRDFDPVRGVVVNG